jgi:hypothetical protein
LEYWSNPSQRRNQFYAHERALLRKNNYACWYYVNHIYCGMCHILRVKPSKPKTAAAAGAKMHRNGRFENGLTKA